MPAAATHDSAVHEQEGTRLLLVLPTSSPHHTSPPHSPPQQQQQQDRNFETAFRHCNQLMESKQRCLLVYIALGGWLVMIIMLGFNLISNYEDILPQIKLLANMLKNHTTFPQYYDHVYNNEHVFNRRQ